MRPLLFLDTRAELGGDGVILLDMLRALIHDPRPITVALPAQGELSEQVQALAAAHPGRIELRLLNFGYSATRLGRALGLIATLLALLPSFYRTQTPILHSNNTRRTLAFALILWLLSLGRMRWVIHGHCSPQPGLIHQLSFKLCEAIWAVSQATTAEYHKAGFPQARCLLNGSTAFKKQACQAETRRWSAALGLRSDELNIAIFGRLAPHKGQELAISAFLKWQARSQKKARLWIVGDDAIPDNNQNYLSSLQAMVRAAKAEDKVLFLGFQRETRPLLELASLVLVPSLEESFGLTALEAIAAKRPILATGPKGLGELLASLAMRPVERSAEAFSTAFDAALNERPAELALRAASAEQLYGPEAFARRLQRALAELDPETARDSALTLQTTPLRST